MQQLVQVVRVRMQQFLSSSLSFLFFSYAPAYIFHGLQCLQGCTAPGIDSSMGCRPFGCVFHPPCSISYTCVPSFPCSIPPTPLTFPECFHKHHILGCWAQLSPLVGPLWRWLQTAVSGTGWPPISSHTQHLCSSHCQNIATKYNILEHDIYRWIFKFKVKAQSTSIHNANTNLY